ncbi:unnamed protein product [Rhizophagus irregularis]|nr:unnamed protein product [Rhizophagus irregularis]
MSFSNTITKGDENFLKEFLKDFYRQVIKIKYYPKFENILTEWTKDYFNHNEKNPEIILKLMEEHEESDNWFSSLIGFFYNHNIGYVVVKEKKSLKLYLLSINNYKNKKLISSMYQLLNIIIAKYLISIHYYKDIICNKKNLIEKELNVMTYNQFEVFNGLEINLCKDEINTMEKYFESLDNNGFNENQIDYTKKKELEELNNLGYCYQFGMGKNKDSFKAC